MLPARPPARPPANPPARSGHPHLLRGRLHKRVLRPALHREHHVGQGDLAARRASPLRNGLHQVGVGGGVGDKWVGDKWMGTW